MRKIFTLLTFLSLFCGIQAQSLVSFEEQEVVTTLQLSFVLGLENVEYNVQTYKVNYMTTDVFGQPTEASGMVSVPLTLDSTAFPIAVYNHGTVSNREEVPSRQGVGERFLVNAFGTNGFITIAPDYLGLGDNPGLHPYVHAESEAQAGYDMILAVREMLDNEGIPFSDDLFTTGYSQGGHASMALQQMLQEDPTDLLPVLTAAAHLSGPYSISDVMAGVLFDPDTETLPGYLAYTYISYNFVYELYDSLGQVFVEPYLSPIEDFSNEIIDLGELNVALFALLDTEDADLPDMFQDSILDAIQNQPDAPVKQALEDNDTYNFAPEAPTLLVYCTEDEQVPFQNALLADSVMTQDLGSENVETFNGGALDHGGCVFPAATEAVAFFQSFLSTSSTREPKAVGQRDLSPNPVNSGGLITLGTTVGNNATYRLHSLSGQVVATGQLNAGTNTIRLPQLPAGIYSLQLLDTQLTTNKIIIR